MYNDSNQKAMVIITKLKLNSKYDTKVLFSGEIINVCFTLDDSRYFCKISQNNDVGRALCSETRVVGTKVDSPHPTLNKSIMHRW